MQHYSWGILACLRSLTSVLQDLLKAPKMQIGCHRRSVCAGTWSTKGTQMWLRKRSGFNWVVKEHQLGKMVIGTQGARAAEKHRCFPALAPSNQIDPWGKHEEYSVYEKNWLCWHMQFYLFVSGSRTGQAILYGCVQKTWSQNLQLTSYSNARSRSDSSTMV